jgi:putative membrane protein
VVLLVAVVGGSFFVSVAPWVWVMGGVLVICGGLLAHDRARALGHRAGDGWLVARSGSLERRRDCIAAGGIIGWTVRQTFFQRRAGVATLVAATAAGVKGYRVLDVPADLAWSVAAVTTPWVADQEWARGRQLGGC